MKWRSLEESSPALDTRPLRQIFAERKELIAKYVPPETQAIHARAVAQLKEKHFAATILPVGAKVPRFDLPDHDGRIVRSSDLLAKGTLVLRRADGSDESRLAADRAGRSDARRRLSADGEAGVLHARPAQAALSAACRCRQPGRQKVRPDLPRA